MDLSIIIPHYNSVEKLKKLLKTIPKKDNLQIIVIDDKSDEKLDELNKLINNRVYSHITFLRNETELKGAGVCRNIGLKKARGKWIVFADSDDYFMENFYSNVRMYFNKNYDVVFFSPTSIETRTGLISDRHLRYKKLIYNYINKQEEVEELHLRYQFFAPWSKLIRKSFLDKNQIIFDAVLASNDVMFSTKLGYFMENFKVDNEVIYCVTRDIGTLTTNINVKLFEERLKVHIDYCRFLKEKLDCNSYRILNPNGMGMLISALKYQYGVSKIISTFIELKKNDVPILDSRIFNPFFTLKKLTHYFIKHLNNKKFLSNKKL